MRKKVNVAVVGVGAVGAEILKVLKQRNFPIDNLKVLARSSREMELEGQVYSVDEISPDAFEGMHIALFAGTEGEKGASVVYSPEAIKRGTVVIDNGSDFRMKEGVPLVVPEINPQEIPKHKGIISNPNCSTIQLALALWPIYKQWGIEDIVISTYQSVSGAGRQAMDELLVQTEHISKGEPPIKAEALPHNIAFEVIPHIGDFGDYDYTQEEIKCAKETHKIFGDNTIKITATCARVPVFISHSQAVYIRTRKPTSIQEIRKLLSDSAGIKVEDDPGSSLYPLACNATDKDEVFVGRLREDPNYPQKGFWLWVVADNLRKGAALNAVQIAEKIIEFL